MTNAEMGENCEHTSAGACSFCYASRGAKIQESGEHLKIILKLVKAISNNPYDSIKTAAYCKEILSSSAKYNEMVK